MIHLERGLDVGAIRYTLYEPFMVCVEDSAWIIYCLFVSRRFSFL
jgi:hypothetical protein